jgi:hypothetical protein
LYFWRDILIYVWQLLPKEVLVRRIPVVGLVLALAVTLGACSISHQKAAEQAIAKVANKLDVPPINTLPSTKLLALPNSYGQPELDMFIYNYQMVFGHIWMDTLQGLDLDVAWPGDLRYLAPGKGDGPSNLTTTCPDYNQQSVTVSKDSTQIFYCATDKMSVPGIVQYPQGTLWVPLKALLSPIHLAGPTSVTPGQQTAQALFVRLTADWADGLTRQIRAYAADNWHINLPKLEQLDQAQVATYCLAGAMGRAVFGADSVVANAVYIIYGDELGMPQRVNAAALKTGFTQGTFGACVKAYWPITDLP